MTITQKCVSRNLGSDWKKTIWPSGDYTIGRSQPPKRDNTEHPLEGIERDGLGISFSTRQIQVVPNGEQLFKLAEKYEDAGNDQLAEQFGRAAGQAFANEDSGSSQLLQQYDCDPNKSLLSKFDENLPVTSQFSGSVDESLLPDLPDNVRSSLGLSVASNSHSKHNHRRGLNGITGYNKRMIKSCAVLLEKKYGRECMAFGTATLPPMEQWELEIVSSGWAELTRRFAQGLKRLLRSRGLSDEVLHVTEVQEKRYLHWGQVYLHLHWLMQGRLKKQWYWSITPEEIQTLWSNLLSNLLGREVDCKAATRIENPRKALSKEMGKYLSKGGKLLKLIKDDGNGRFLPTAWWGANNLLKREVKKAIRITTGQEVLDFIDSMEAMQNAGLLKFRPICIEYMGREITVGWVGFITNRELQAVLAA